MMKQDPTDAERIAETGGTGIRKHSRVSDILLLILSVLIAFLLWLYAMSVSGISYERERVFTSLPVDILGDSAQLSVYSSSNSTLDITVRGPKNEISRLSEADITVSVDINGIQEAGRYTLPVSVTLPAGITLVGQSFNTMTMYLDNRSSAVVPVTAKITSYQLAEGYEIGTGDIRLSVDEINVTGPESVLKTIASAQASLQLGQVTSSVVIASDLTLVDQNGDPINNTYLKMGITNVTATVPVYMYRILPLEVGCKYGYLNASSAQINVTPSFIRVKGEVSDVQQLSAIPLATIDEKKLVADTISIPVTMPAGITNVDGVGTATVTVKHIGTTTKELVVDRITVNNPKGLDYELLTDTLNVMVRGREMYLNYLSPSDIEAVIDLSYLNSASGTISVPASIRFASSVSDGNVYEIGDYKVSISLR